MAQVDHPGFVRYNPTEIVGAMRISSITKALTTQGYLVKDRGEGSALISKELFDRHNVHSGGYLILLSNEKLSFLPAEAFTDLVRI